MLQGVLKTKFLFQENGKLRPKHFDYPLNVDWDGNELLLSDILGTDENLIMKI